MCGQRHVLLNTQKTSTKGKALCTCCFSQKKAPGTSHWHTLVMLHCSSPVPWLQSEELPPSPWPRESKFSALGSNLQTHGGTSGEGLGGGISWGTAELCEQMRGPKGKQKQQLEGMYTSIAIFQKSRWLGFLGIFKFFFKKTQHFLRQKTSPRSCRENCLVHVPELPVCWAELLRGGSLLLWWGHHGRKKGWL